MKTKKIISLLVMLSLLFSAMTMPADAAVTLYTQQGKYSGDINRDGKLNAADARILLRLSAGLEEQLEEDLEIADVNSSGNLTSSDARLVLRVAAEIEDVSVLHFIVGYDKNTDHISQGGETDVPVTENDTVRFSGNSVISYKGLVGGEIKIISKNSVNAYTSSNSSVATVSQSGTVYCVSDGFACIIVSTSAGKCYLYLTVQTALQKKIDSFRNVYPQGYYWNRYPKSTKYPKVTETPCDHYAIEEQYGDYMYMCCGQCAGFAALMSNEVFGSDAPKYTYSESTQVRVGDYVRYSGRHSIFIIKVVKTGDVIDYDRNKGKNILASSDYFEVVHCNWDHKCGIDWDTKIYLSKITLNRNYCYSRVR